MQTRDAVADGIVGVVAGAEETVRAHGFVSVVTCRARTTLRKIDSCMAIFR